MFNYNTRVFKATAQKSTESWQIE